MRSLIALVVVAASLWSGYWFVAAHGVRTALSAWLAARAEDGWVVTPTTFKVRGFPNRLDTTLDDVHFADAGWAWNAPFFQVFMLSYRPNQVIAVWPHTQSLRTAAGTFQIASRDMRGSATFKPQSDLALDHMALVIKGLNATSDTGFGLSAENARFASRLVPARPGTQQIGVALEDAQLPQTMLAALGLPPQTPVQIDTVLADADLSFDRPWNLEALDGSRPKLTAARLRNLTIKWGDMELTAKGGLSRDAQGRMQGEVTLQAVNWRGLLRLAADAGLITPEVAARLEPGLAGMAALSVPDETTLDVPLKFRDGIMRFGSIPIGPAPRWP